MGQQRFHLLPQGAVIATGLAEKRPSRLRRDRQCFVVDAFDVLPPFRSHLFVAPPLILQASFRGWRRRFC
jgi:hypothetical protein